MFERFSDDARSVVADAQDEARRLGHRYIGTEHLLLAMLAGSSPSGEMLREAGLTVAWVRQRIQAGQSRIDADALARLGIDLEAVQHAAEARFGAGALFRSSAPLPSGHLRLTKRAKQILGLAVREAVADQADSISSVYLLLGLLREGDGLAVHIVRTSKIDTDQLANAARLRVGRSAA